MGHGGEARPDHNPFSSPTPKTTRAWVRRRGERRMPADQRLCQGQGDRERAQGTERSGRAGFRNERRREGCAAGPGWDQPGPHGKVWREGAKRGSLPRLPPNSLSTSTGRWPIMAARCRAGYPELGQPAEPSGEREPERSPENAASSGLTPKPATLRVAANHRSQLFDRHGDRPIDFLSPAPYARTAGQAS